jgi:hypothetical protein
LSVTLCPHCGANREGMNDQQPCWRCKRLPYSSTPSRSAGANAPNIPVGYGGYVPANSPYLKPYERSRRASCLLIGGVFLGITGLMALVAFLVMTLLTEEDGPSATPDNVALIVPTETALTLPNFYTNTPPDAVAIGVAGGEAGVASTPQVAVGPFAETAVAQQPIPVSPAFTPLPSPTIAPTFTVPVDPINCPGSPPTRLSISQQALVINNPSVRMRADPGLEAVILQEVIIGTEVNITGGPACVSDILWWQVQLTSGTVGWIAEGLSGSYYLEPTP